MKFHQKNGQRYFAMFLSAVLTAGTMMAALIVPSASARVVDKYVGTFTYDFLKDGKSCYEAENVVDGYLDNDSFTRSTARVCILSPAGLPALPPLIRHIADCG